MSHPFGTLGVVGEELAFVTRAVVFHVDPTPAQERMLRSYCGAARFAYNWVLDQVTDNLTTRTSEREAGVGDDELSPWLSWAPYSLRKKLNADKSHVAPWWAEVAKHAFDTGVNHQLSWFNASRHGVRLMLPKSLVQSKDKHTRRVAQQLVWLHTVESTRRLYNLVEDGRATIQKVTISYTSGRWQVSFMVRYQYATRPVKRPRERIGGTVGVDFGLTHLATLSVPVPGLTDEDGHVPNPRPLAALLEELKDLDRQIARCQKGSKNRAKLVRQRARLHGRIASIRKAAHHRLSNELAARFDLVGIEDLNVAGMTHNRPLARALADAGLGQLRTIITTECNDRDTPVIAVGRFYPSSKTCSDCGAAKAKLPLNIRTFDCDRCAMTLDRDMNASRNIAREAIRLHEQQQDDHVVGLRPKTQNADPRSQKTRRATAREAVAA